MAALFRGPDTRNGLYRVDDDQPTHTIKQEEGGISNQNQEQKKKKKKKGKDKFSTYHM